MSKRSMAMALLALAGVVGATEAQAATTCGTTVTFSPGTQTINYDPFGTTDQTVALSVSITVPNNVNSVRLITTDSQSGSPTKVGTSGPQYQLLLNGTNIAFPLGTNASSQPTIPAISTAGGGGSSTFTQPLTLVIRADPNQSLTSGSFTEALGYSIQCFHPNQGNSGNQNFDEQNFTTGGPTVNVSVSSSARFTTASAADIDFGNFSQTTAKTVVTIQSTSNYDLTVSNASKSSQGQAALVLNASGSPVGSNALIPYSMKFNNTAIPASGTLLNQPRVGTTGQQFDFLLDIGSLPAGKLSGTYRDVITLTLVPR